MPSLTARAVQWLLRSTGAYKKMFSGGPGFAAMQAQALSVPADPPAKLAKSVSVMRSSFQARDVWEIAPKDGRVTTTVLFWHGGGYVYPASPAHWAFLGHMAKVHGWRSIAPLYPLAPEHDVDAVTRFALDYYRSFVEEQRGAPFMIAGDSAGGGLSAAVLMAARDQGLPLPERAILICPWLEANPVHPEQASIEPRDSILTLRGIKEAGEMYAGSAPVSDPRVSPIHGDWSGLPPILAFGGTTDILLIDARALKARVPTTDYVEGDGLMHDWPIFFFPESRAAQRRMAAFAQG